MREVFSRDENAPTDDVVSRDGPRIRTGPRAVASHHRRGHHRHSHTAHQYLRAISRITKWDSTLTIFPGFEIRKDTSWGLFYMLDDEITVWGMMDDATRERAQPFSRVPAAVSKTICKVDSCVCRPKGGHRPLWSLCCGSRAQPGRPPKIS